MWKSVREKLDEIKDKYNLEEGIEDLFIAREFINIWYENTSDNRENTVAIYGAGGNSNILLNMLVKWNEVNKVAVVIDNFCDDKEIYGVPIVKESELDDYKIDMVWISSWKHEEEMSQRIIENYPNVRCVKPYQNLRVKFPKIDIKDIINYTSSNRYMWFSDKLILRDHATTIEEITRLSQMLIAGYCCICDWVSLKKEVQLYSKNKYRDYEKYNKLMDDVETLLRELSEKISDRKNSSTVIYVVDALSKYVAAKMPNLTEWKKEGLEFVEYRNDYPTTHEFFLSMFTGWRPFEDETYLGRAVKWDSSDLLRYLDEKKVAIKILSQNSKISRDFKEINTYFTKCEENAFTSEVLFNGICELCNEECEQIVVIHMDVTVHSPHFTPITRFIPYSDVVNSKAAHEEYFDIAVNYTDEIVSFYTDILDKPSDITQIVMGDHGINLDLEYACRIAKQHYAHGGAQWNKPMISPDVIIRNNRITKGRFEGLISANRFVDILFEIVKGNDPYIKIKGQEVVPIELVPGYDLPWIMLGVNSNNFYLPMGGAGCMSKEWMYINTELGEDLYYQIIDDDIRVVENKDEVSNIIKILDEKNVNNSKFPKAILKQEFFEKHNKMYVDKMIKC